MDLIIRLGGLRAAVMLHMLLLNRIMHVPLWFFDTTPVGRIMSRFSKDIDTVDQSLMAVINTCIWCAFEVISLRFLLLFLSQTKCI